MNKYFNREISWLKFNERVNELSFDKNVPILERLNFISIAASNLDEFFSVRVAGLIEQLKLSPNKKSYDGMKIEDQIKLAEAEIGAELGKNSTKGPTPTHPLKMGKT